MKNVLEIPNLTICCISVDSNFIEIQLNNGKIFNKYSGYFCNNVSQQDADIQSILQKKQRSSFIS